jgi:peroxiredoxin
MPLSAGDPAPPLRVEDPSGRPAAMAGRAGRPALLLFYRADCGASGVAGPVLRRFAAIPGLDVAAVSQDPAAEARAFGEACGFGSAVLGLVDPEPWRASHAFGVRVTPTWFLVAADGRIAAAAEGWSRDDANALAAEAARLCGAPPVVVARPDGPEPALRPG